MADFAHLEKMGRELKCPICLSLLNSAASLTCNHVFCNDCLTKSMKSDSHCPVCKVPYRRREIRPAPHMDNLVSIYKNMEAASGINIHVTQNALSTKDSGNNQFRSNADPEKSDTAKLSHGKSKKKRKFKNVSKEPEKTTEKTSDPQLYMKPSFPAKKRVHVPQCLPTETPTRLSKYEEKSGKEGKKGSWDGSNVLKEKPSFTARGEPVFSPFFWIREREEGENDEFVSLSSQTTENYRVTYTPPPKFSFNDINDTNDASPVKATGPEKVDPESKAADVFDSEMFEWTQRACSPELCTTPVKNKAVSQKESKKPQEKNEEGSQYFTPPSRDELFSENMKDGTGFSNSAKDTTASKGKTKPNKSGKCKRKQDALCVDKAHEGAEGLYQGSDPDTLQKTEKKKKKATFDTNDLRNPTEASLQPHEQEIQNQSSENVKLNSSKTVKRSRKPKMRISTGQNLHDDTSTAKVLKEVSADQEQGNENVKAQSSLISSQRKTLKNSEGIAKGFFNGAVLKKCSTSAAKKSQTTIEPKRSLENTVISPIQPSTEVSTVAKNVSLRKCSTSAAKKTQTTIEPKRSPENTVISPIQPSNKVLTVTNNMSLRKCENARSLLSCVFCHSSRESEVSGKMMHYSNGKPVAPNHSGEHSVIHAHRNCTEWAPNVYFDDETAINLESEVARSKKIKCSLCGIKGAALGCYEKSCRKSFHVPCAKLVEQCRWDTDNFVMLCPLHPSSKLPKELPGSQPKKRKQSIPKRDTQGLKVDGVTHQSAIAKTLWKGSSNKWVLCCSGLANTEKEIVSEFAKLAGLTLSTTYAPNVTHIIASTDENGACRRTLKFLLGILEGKWILKIDWVKACMESMKPVCEEKYEINVDIHGIKDGPRLGRLRVLNKEPKLFHGCNFYFFGEFLTSYKGYLQDMVVAAGGTVLQRKPISGSVSECSFSPRTFIIYNAEATEKHDHGPDAKALADTTGSKVAAHTWILDSIAACKMQAL